MSESCNCDYQARLDDLKRKGKIVYGKKILPSYKPYELWNENTDTFDIDKINKLYMLFKYNMAIVSKYFRPIWVEPEELLVTTKTMIWDWTSQEELEMTANSIETFGVYLPIFVLPKGMLHNQICDKDEMDRLKSINLYNSYNGNHRIDAIQYLKKNGRFNKKVLVYEIPPFCEKSCTGFRYTRIDHNEENELTNHKFEEPIIMSHLYYLEDEMKMYNLKTFYKDNGISSVVVDNYNTAFRIMTEFQNALEPPLTRYFEIYGKLPDGFDNKYFNDYDIWVKNQYGIRY